MSLLIKSLISRIAVSFEHFAILAHFEDVNLPSNLSNILFNNFFCLSLTIVFECFLQNSALYKTRFKTISVDLSEFIKQFKNHFIHSVMSRLPFCVFSSIS